MKFLKHSIECDFERSFLWWSYKSIYRQLFMSYTWLKILHFS